MTRLWARLCEVARPFSDRRFLWHVFGLPLLTATVVFTICYLASDRQIVAKVADDAMKRRMSLFSGTVKPSLQARPFVFIDFDDNTSYRLGDPVFVSTATLGRALTQLAQNRPWVVVIAIDFADLGTPNDLAGVADGLQALSQQGTMVLLARETLAPARPDGSIRIRPTPLDPLVEKLPGVMWTALGYWPSVDGVIRELEPFVAVERGTERLTLPSVPLALATLARHTSAANAEAALGSAYAKRRNTEDTLVVETPRGALQIPPGPALIAFSLPWPPQLEAQHRLSVAGRDRPLMQRVPMLPLLGPRPLPQGLYDGVGVFIAATAYDRDFVQTPLDAMPRAFVVVNASRAWIEFGVPARSPFWLGLTILIIYFAALSLAFHMILRGLHTYFSERWQSRVEGQLPTLLSALIWLTFYVVGGSAVSLALVVTSYFVLLSMTFSHRRLRSLPPIVAADEPRPHAEKDPP